MAEPEWLKPADRRILQWLRRRDYPEDIQATPGQIGKNLDLTPNYVGERCRELVGRGLLMVTDEQAGYYTISSKGRDYLAGNLDLEE